MESLTPPPELLEYAALVAAGLGGGFINTVAGGGSLLTLPALMLVGLPVHEANGSNRLAVVTHSIAGVLGFQREGRLPRRALAPVVLPTMAGAGLGAWAASVAPEAVLRPALLSMLVGMALLLLVRPRLVDPAADEAPRPALEHPGALLGLAAAGFYGGLVQAGVGFVLLGVLGGLLRYDPVRANALKLACTLLFGLLALGIFAAAGQVRWVPAAVLAAATAVGAQLGVRFALRVSAAALRWVLFVTVALSCAAVWLKG
ncbi:MAG: sulfite exporter TauE/SafE family protein [Sandaracinaceae bacterium]